MSVLGRNTPDTEAGGLICSECNRSISGPMKAHKTKYEIYCAWCYASIEKEIVPPYVHEKRGLGDILGQYGLMPFFVLGVPGLVIFGEDKGLGAIVYGWLLIIAVVCCLIYGFRKEWWDISDAEIRHGMREFTARQAMVNLPARDLAEIRANPIEGLNIYYDATFAGRRS